MTSPENSATNPPNLWATRRTSAMLGSIGWRTVGAVTTQVADDEALAATNPRSAGRDAASDSSKPSEA